MKYFVFYATILFLALTLNAQQTCTTALEVEAGLHSFDYVDGQAPSELCVLGGGVVNAGIWFKYSPDEDVNVTVFTDFSQNIGIDNRVNIFTGDCDNLICVAGNDDFQGSLLCVVSFVAQHNKDYFIVFDDMWDISGFDFEVIENPIGDVDSTYISFTETQLNLPGIVFSRFGVADMNGDYLDDLFYVRDSVLNIVAQQENGEFVFNQFVSSAVSYPPDWSMTVGDINNDGFNDLVFGGHNGVSFMISDGEYLGYSHWSTPDFVFSQRTNFVDINNDGHLDAFVCHDVAPNVFYINDGQGGLTFNQGGIGDHPEGGHYGSIWVDYDNDGDLDLFISKCRGGQGSVNNNELYRNNGDGTFTDVSLSANMNHPNQTWSSAWNDFDNDGFMDALVGVSSFSSGGHLLMHNNGDGTFEDITIGSGWDTHTETSWEYVSYDFNNDGFVDILTDDYLFYNNRNKTFTKVEVPFKVGGVGDLNNDGFLDVINQNKVFYNNGNEFNWLKFNLKGFESNPNGIGSRIEVYSALGKQIRDVQSGIGFGQASSLNTHVGLGLDEIVDSVIVKWPSGIVDRYCNIKANITLFVEEGTASIPLAGFETSDTLITINENIIFTDTSLFCPTSWQWSVEPNEGWLFINGTNPISQHPTIQFNTVGTYEIMLSVENLNGGSENGYSKEIRVTDGLGITSENSLVFDVFPNPANEIVYLDKLPQNSNLRVYDLFGNKLIEHYGVKTKHEINVSTFSNGVYIIQVENNGIKQNKKLVVNK